MTFQQRSLLVKRRVTKSIKIQRHYSKTFVMITQLFTKNEFPCFKLLYPWFCKHTNPVVTGYVSLNERIVS